MTSAMHLDSLEARVVERLRVFSGGSGTPVVLLHGLGGTSANWLDVAPVLAAAHRVVAVDLPGHGGSRPLAGGTTVASFADAVAAALDAEEVSGAIVVGHSFGGLIALRLALRRPELVRSLLLVAPAGIKTSTRVVEAVVSVVAVVRPGRLAARLAPRHAGKPWFRRAAFGRWFVSDPLSLSRHAADGLLSGQLEHSDVRTAGRAMVADDPRAELARVTCPALVLWGACDPQLPLDDAFEYARRLGAPLRVVADCGHLVLVERPDAVLDGIRYLDELPLEPEAGGEVLR